MKIKIYKTVILPAELNGCKTRCPILRRAQAESICEQDFEVSIRTHKRRMKKSSKCKSHRFYSLHNVGRLIKCRRLTWAGHEARMKEGKITFKILNRKPTGKRPIKRLRQM